MNARLIICRNEQVIKRAFIHVHQVPLEDVICHPSMMPWPWQDYERPF
jgi:hypothetical protein